MEDPRADIKYVVRALLERPNLQRQEQTLRKYFSPDVTYYHHFLNNAGLENLITTYQFAEIVYNYRKVDFKTIFYDESTNIVSVQMTVVIRPVLMYFTKSQLDVLSVFELEDFVGHTDDREKGGSQRVKKLKRIRVQRDFFNGPPIALIEPFLGNVSWGARILTGACLTLYRAVTFRRLRKLFTFLVPREVRLAIPDLLTDSSY